MVSCRVPSRPNLSARGQGVHGWPFKAQMDVLCGGDRRCGERKGKGELFERDHGGGGR